MKGTGNDTDEKDKSEDEIESQKDKISKETQTFITSLARGFIARQKYAIKHIPKPNLAYFKTLPVGNDPLINLPEAHKHQDEKVALIATSGLRCVSIACELTSATNLPKIFLVDNSEKVHQFWSGMKEIANDENKAATAEMFLTNVKGFLAKNRNMCAQIASDFRKNYRQDVKYPDQDIEAFLRDLFEKFGYEKVRKVISHASLIKQSWGDEATFQKIANIIQYHKIEKVYVYPSNIVATIQDETLRKQILENIQDKIKPALAIHSDVCGQHKAPENILFFENGDVKSIESVIQNSPACRH